MSRRCGHGQRKVLDDAKVWHLVRRTGLTRRVVAERFGVSVNAVNAALRREEELRAQQA